MSEQQFFDRNAVEAKVREVIRDLTGDWVAVFESRTPGVVAIERIDGYGTIPIEWQNVASLLANETGLAVVCIADCHWGFDDRCDEKATFIAFDVPDLSDEYRNDNRNKISLVEPDATERPISTR